MNNPTDTNQASELFELCKKVYELTEWDSGKYFEPLKPGGRSSNYPPKYTSDYLLEKLPGLLDIDNKTFSLAVQAQVAPPDFVALYTHTSVVAGKLAGHSTRYINVADTPLKALLRLTIALSEAGELKMTNQASKDGIRDLLRIIDIESGDEPDSYWIDESSIEKATAAIQELIRTEKLKLLAEVRGRVVGEDLPTYGPQNENGDISEQDYLTYGANDLRAEQRIELTKLEAEL